MSTHLVKSGSVCPQVAAYHEGGLLARVIHQKSFSFEVSGDAAKRTLAMTYIRGKIPVRLFDRDEIQSDKMALLYNPSKVVIRACFQCDIISCKIDIQNKLPLKKVGKDEYIQMPNGSTFCNLHTIERLFMKMKEEHAVIKGTLAHNELLVTAPSQAKSLGHIAGVIIPKSLLSQPRGLLVIIHQMRRKIPGRPLCLYHPKSGLVELAVDSVLRAIQDLAIKKRDRRLFLDAQYVMDPRTQRVRSRL